MAPKLLLVYLLATFSIALTTNATTYTVGDNSGWDISTDIDSWVQDKVFKVGDSLRKSISSCEKMKIFNGNNEEGLKFFIFVVLQCSNTHHPTAWMKRNEKALRHATRPMFSVRFRMETQRLHWHSQARGILFVGTIYIAWGEWSFK